MAPEFLEFIACGLLIVASVVACGLLALAAISQRVFRRVLQRKFPRVARLIRPALMLALLPTFLLLGVTAFYARAVHQQFFLNEPMATAASQGNLDDVRNLLDRGASPDAWGIDYRETALLGAAEGGHAEIVQLLLERGADPNLRDGDQRSPLRCARDGAHARVVQLLVLAGARE